MTLKEGTSIKDGFVEAKFKPISGSEDRAGGLVWRAKDANNYYVARANALEDNVVLYKTVNGVRSSLDIVGRQGGYGVKEAGSANRWQTLRVVFAGTRFKVIFNDKALFELEDATFAEPGMVGFARRPTVSPLSMPSRTAKRSNTRGKDFHEAALTDSCMPDLGLRRDAIGICARRC